MAEPVQVVIGRRYVHRRGGKYVVLHIGRLESDLTPVVIYRRSGENDGIWVRPLTEFSDGRFQPAPGEAHG